MFVCISIPLYALFRQWTARFPSICLFFVIVSSGFKKDTYEFEQLFIPCYAGIPSAMLEKE
jgi:hypothetical protein